MNAGQRKRLIDRVLMLATSTKGHEAVISLGESQSGNTRFAVNEITTSGEIQRLNLAVTVQIGKRSAFATTNQLDDRSIDDVVSRARRMAQLAPEDPETMPLLGKQTYIAVPKATDPATVAAAPDVRAKAASVAIAAAKAAKVAIAGFYEHSVQASALANSAGLYADHTVTTASLSCTARTPDGTGSGWSGVQSNRIADIDAVLLAKTAVDKATASARPRRLEAGRYTVILEPAAVAGLIGEMLDFDARRADEGRSFFSKSGGATKSGEKLFPDIITLRADPTDAGLATAPFDGEGFPRTPRAWIDKGTVTGLTYSRFWAKKQGKQPTGNPGGWILEGGKATREELIKGVKRGVLITRFWYIRGLDPQTVLATGLTRDGTFLIENGAIVGSVNNFRFNESPVQMLAKCDGLTASTLVEGMRVPALRTHEFNLASISEAV
jgi:predicted Zn-dependent protease